MGVHSCTGPMGRKELGDCNAGWGVGGVKGARRLLCLCS